MTVTRVELGCPGHLCVARYCQWRRHTQVGHYRVSTVGDYYPPDRHTRDTIGIGPSDFFETMVFSTFDQPEKNNDGCGCRELQSLDAIECERYATAGEAQAGHEQLVQKYLEVAQLEEAAAS